MPERDEIHVMPDGTRIRLRPIRADDGPALADFVAHHMTAEDLRFRFFAPLKELSPALVERLTHPDPAREVAIAATFPQDDAPIAVGRLAANLEENRAEYALAVQSEHKGHGIGYFLLGRLIAIARARGYREIFGLVLRDNERMLQMAGEYGFRRADEPAEPGVVRVSLDLVSR